MRVVALLYHGIVEAGAHDSSGFKGGDANLYKLDRREFEDHLSAIAEAVRARSLRVDTVPVVHEPAVMLTFDDGGASAHPLTAELLEKHDWRGHFFVTTSFIGRRGFIGRGDIVALRRRGHVIGTHSHSHPTRMSRCTPGELEREWSESRAILSDILGEPVTAASVPGGYYSRRVAEAAALAGIRYLFNSEPVTSVQEVDGCAVFGRFAVKRRLSARAAASIAAGRAGPRLGHFLLWNGKKVLKAAGGEYWLMLRKALLAER